MIYSEIRDAVYALTNRPDLVTETALAIQRATVKLHSADFWPRDLTLAAVTLGAASFNPQIIAATSLPRLRAINYITARDPLSGFAFPTSEKHYEHITPEALLDEYLTQKKDVWFQSGSTVQILSSTSESQFFVGYYAQPVVSPAADGTYSSWIATEVPYAIINEAAAVILRSVGHAELSNIYVAFAVEDLAQLRQNYLDGVAK